MTSRVYLSISCVLVALTVAGAGFVASRTHQRRLADQALRAERVQLAATRAQWQSRLAAAERERTDLYAELRALPIPAEPLLTRPTPDEDPAQAAERAALDARRDKARTTLKYLAFYRTQNIPSETARRLEQVITDFGVQEQALFTIRRGPIPPEERSVEIVRQNSDGSTFTQGVSPAVAALWNQIAPQYEADQIAVLGEQGYRALQEYRRTERRRRVVENLAADLALVDTPLSTDQTTQLTSILTEVGLDIPTASALRQWREILPRAEAVLNPAQFALLKRQADRVENSAARDAYSDFRMNQMRARAGSR